MAVNHDYTIADLLRDALGTSDNAWTLLEAWKATNGLTHWDDYVTYLRTQMSDPTGNIADVQYEFWLVQAAL